MAILWKFGHQRSHWIWKLIALLPFFSMQFSTIIGGKFSKKNAFGEKNSSKVMARPPSLWTWGGGYLGPHGWAFRRSHWYGRGGSGGNCYGGWSAGADPGNRSCKPTAANSQGCSVGRQASAQWNTKHWTPCLKKDGSKNKTSCIIRGIWRSFGFGFFFGILRKFCGLSHFCGHIFCRDLEKFAVKLRSQKKIVDPTSKFCI